MDLWERETSRYHKRLNRLIDWKPDLSGFAEGLPSIPLDYSPSEKGSVSLQLSLYVLGCVQVCDQAVASFSTLFRKGLFTTISLPARLIYELWGATHYATKVIIKMQKSGDVTTAMKMSRRLTLGARSDVDLPWGGQTDEKSVHVMEFIRSLSDTNSRADQDYDFLCESCHPSYLRLTIWSLSGPVIGNWANEKFRTGAHGIFERTLSITELSLRGIADESKMTLEAALPFIQNDRFRNKA